MHPGIVGTSREITRFQRASGAVVNKQCRKVQAGIPFRVSLPMRLRIQLINIGDFAILLVLRCTITKIPVASATS